MQTRNPILDEFAKLTTGAMGLAQAALSLPVPPEYALQQLNIENPIEMIDGWIEWQLLQQLVGDLVQKTKLRAGEMEASAVNLQELAQAIAQLSPEEQAALAQMGVPGAEGMESPGNVLQGLSNVTRGGIPQGPSQTEANRVGVV